MNVIDEFFLLFKSNAKDVQKDVQAAHKATDDFQQEIDDTNEAAGKLGVTFGKLALAGIAALEGFASLGKLKDGIVNAINYNAQLEKTAKLTNVNARELSVWNDIVARAGGNPASQEYLNFISKLNQQYAGLGANQRIQYVNRDLGELADTIKRLNDAVPGSGYALAQKLGIGDDLYLALKNGKAALQEDLQLMGMLDNSTAKGAESALDLKKQWVDIGTVFRSAFNDFSPLAKLFTTFVEGLAFGIKGLGAVFQSITHLSLEPLKQAYAASGVAAARLAGASTPSYATGGNFGTNEAESAAYWKSQGYSPAQVAALLSNERAESSFNSASIGDNGAARGIFQWHAPRRARILAATGIDVASASHTDQLRAAAWELEQTGTSDKLRAAQTPEAGASILTGYEAPANAEQQSFLRGQGANSYFASLAAQGQNAINTAQSTPLPSSSNNSKSVTIGAITINTQATDADGIARDFKGALSQHLADTVGSFDDGVQY